MYQAAGQQTWQQPRYLQSSPNAVWIIKPKTRWAWHVTSLQNRISVGREDGNWETHAQMEDDNIKVAIKCTEQEGVD